MISDLTPPAGAPVIGTLHFLNPVEHDVVGSFWLTWSHGYMGDVYFNASNDLLMTLPDGTLAFALYVQPNIQAQYEFQVTAEFTSVNLMIDGNSGARYVGFYTDDPMDYVNYVFVKQTTMLSDGFAVGEFGINVVPETQAWGLVAGLGLGAFAFYRRLKA